VVRGLATGQFGPGNKLRVLAREVLIGLGMGSVLAVCGFVRVYCFFDGDVQASIAVSACLLLLCVAATVLATVLPFSLHQWGLDSAHSAPIAAVAMVRALAVR
jgi:Mg/Co/Ni transporter MgtE